MRAHSAAPGELGGRPGSGGESTGNTAILPQCRDDDAMAVLDAEYALEGVAILLAHARLSAIALDYVADAFDLIRAALSVRREVVGLKEAA